MPQSTLHCSHCPQVESTAGAMIQIAKDAWLCEDCHAAATLNFSDARRNVIDVPSPRQIVKHLDLRVIGQSEAKVALGVAVYRHYRALADAHDRVGKSNIMLVGPTGTGKTELARSIAQMLDVPFAICDATSLTQAGYVGDDVESILARLLEAAEGDVRRAEGGIVYIDEIDKASRKGDNVSLTRDVSGEGVQQALLKLIEGTTVHIVPGGGRKHPEAKTIAISTENILFIAAGAFEGLVDASITKPALGLGQNPVVEAAHASGELTRSLIKFGMLPEFVGRFSRHVSLKPLTVDELVAIATELDQSLIAQHREFLARDGIELVFEPEAVRMAATLAITRGTGARGLKSILDAALEPIVYEYGGLDTPGRITITARHIETGEAPDFEELRKAS